MSTRLILGAVLGAAAGLAWYRLVGCRTGACPLTANPWIASAYGLVMGLLLASHA